MPFPPIRVPEPIDLSGERLANGMTTEFVIRQNRKDYEFEQFAQELNLMGLDIIAVGQYLDDNNFEQAGMSAFALWVEQPGNSTKTLAEFFAFNKGDKGDTGDKGDQGDNVKGDKGDDGLKGESPYELWLQQPGNDGKTVNEYIASLEGAKGDTGDKGDDGDKGDKGDQGDNPYQLWLLQPANAGKTVAQYLADIEGDAGLSNYQLWLNDGNTGTLADFFETTRGPAGPGGETPVSSSYTTDDASIAASTELSHDLDSRVKVLDAHAEASKSLERLVHGDADNVVPLGSQAERLATGEKSWSSSDLLSDGGIGVKGVSSISGTFDLGPAKAFDLHIQVDIIEALVRDAFIGFRWIDPDNILTDAFDFHYKAGTLTTLTEPLAVGDTRISLTSVDEWDSTLIPSYRRIAMADYVDGQGNQHAPGGYTAWVSGDKEFEVSGNRILLDAPWNLACPFTGDGVWPVGHSIRQAFGGSSAHYLSNAAGESRIEDTSPLGVTDFHGSISGDYEHEGVRASSGSVGRPKHFTKGAFFIASYNENTVPTQRIVLRDIECFPVADYLIGTRKESEERKAADQALQGDINQRTTKVDSELAKDMIFESMLTGKGRNLFENGYNTERIGEDSDWGNVTISADGGIEPENSVVTSQPFDIGTSEAYDVRATAEVLEVLARNALIGVRWIDPSNIGAQVYHLHYLGLTTLTAPLSVGDTTISVTDTSDWDAGQVISHKRIALGGYIDADGRSWPPGGYTRWTIDAEDWIIGQPGVISLSNPWSLACPFTGDGVWPVGHSIRQAVSGSGYHYLTSEDGVTSIEPEDPVGLIERTARIEGSYNGHGFRSAAVPIGRPDHFTRMQFAFLAYAENILPAKIVLRDLEIVPVPDYMLKHRIVSGKADITNVLDGHSAHAQAALNRTLWPTGLLSVRQYNYNESFTDERRTHAIYSAGSFHTHADHRHLVGMAEWEAMWHGYYSRQRHTDYLTMQPIQGEYLERRETPPPPVPASVLAKPTGLATDGTLDLVGDTQARWMRELIDGSHNEELQVQLSYAEFWLELVDENAGRTDAADSTRHADVADDILGEFEKNAVLDAGGAKYRFENLGHYPAIRIPTRSEDGTIVDRQYAINYRVSTREVGNMGAVPVDPPVPLVLIGNAASHVHEPDQQITQQQWDDLRAGTITQVLLTSSDVGHSHTFRITWNAAKSSADGEDLFTAHKHPVIIVQGWSGALPFDRDKARDGVIDNTNRFRLRLDPVSMKSVGSTRDGLMSSMLARFECVDLDALMSQCFGMEGEGAVLEESYLQPDGTRQYFFDISDPDPTIGEPSLNAAMYNRRAQAATSDASGRSLMHRGFSDPNLFVAKTTHPRVAGGFTYAIPLEVLIRSPIESWNPAMVTIDPSDYYAFSSLGAGTQGNPYQKVFGKGGWNYTPLGIWPGADATPDPADTPRTLWMRGSDGNSYAMSASGVWRITPGGKRGTLPVYLTAYDGSQPNTEQRAVNRAVKDLLQTLANGGPIDQAAIDSLPIDDDL